MNQTLANQAALVRIRKTIVSGDNSTWVQVAQANPYRVGLYINQLIAGTTDTYYFTAGPPIAKPSLSEVESIATNSVDITYVLDGPVVSVDWYCICYTASFNVMVIEAIADIDPCNVMSATSGGGQPPVASAVQQALNSLANLPGQLVTLEQLVGQSAIQQ